MTHLRDGLITVLTVLLTVGLIASLSMGAGAAQTTEDDVVVAIDDVESYEYETETDTTTIIVEDGDEVETTAQGQSSGVVDVANNEFMETMTVETTGDEEVFEDEIGTQTYLVNDMFYTLTPAPGEDAKWVQMDAPEDDAFTEGPLAEQEQLLAASDVEAAGEETIDGTETYVLELTVNVDAYWDELTAELDDQESEAMNGETDANANGAMNEADTDAVTGSIDEMTVTMWIDAETDQPVKSQLTISTCIDDFPTYETDDIDNAAEDGEDVGEGEIGEIDRVETEMTQTTYFHSYDEPVDIELPDEAEDAQDLDEHLDEIEEDFEAEDDLDVHDEDDDEQGDYRADEGDDEHDC